MTDAEAIQRAAFSGARLFIAIPTGVVVPEALQIMRTATATRSARLRDFDLETDARNSYDDAICAIGERVKAGEPVPEFLRSARASGHEGDR